MLASYRDGQAGAALWRKAGDDLPSFSYRQKQGAVMVFLRPPEGATPNQELAEMLWSQVKQFGDTDGDVLLAMMAQAMEPSQHDEDGSTWITAPAILD